MITNGYLIFGENISHVGREKNARYSNDIFKRKKWEASFTGGVRRKDSTRTGV